VLAWALLALATLGVAPIFWFDHLLRQAGRPELAALTTDLPILAPRLLAGLIAATVGAVLASRRPRHPVGWLLLTLGLSVPAYFVTDGYARYGLLAHPGALPLARYAAVFAQASFILEPLCLGFIPLLTPTGSLPSPRWRWWARGLVVAPARVNLSEADSFGNHCVVAVSSFGSLIQTAVGSAGGVGGLRTKRSGCPA
jgi:hypothetical protein